MREISKTYIIFTLFIFFQNSIFSQDLNGNWKGRFYLDGSQRNWSFEIDLKQDHSKIEGIGKQIELSNKNQTRNINSTFSLEGYFNGEKLVYNMKDVLFLKSPNGQCLARCQYRFNETHSKYQFIGECNRNGVFYKNENYYPNHLACNTPATTKVIFEKAKDINGRKTEVVEEVDINQSKVTVKIWDSDKVDGDVISLNLNGYWVLKNYKITNKVKTIMFTLADDSNDLILYAENLGRLPPNTAAISVWQGKEKLKEIVLNSDMNRSEGIRILKSKVQSKVQSKSK